jgi:hypothetical protein
MIIRGEKEKEIEKKEKKKKKKRCLFVKGTGGERAGWERRRRRADEVMRNAKRRGIGTRFISETNRSKQLR